MDNEIFFPKIKLEKLELRNYRVFPYLPSIKFDDNLTVIIGNNGSGKTTLLDGVAVFVQYFVYEIILGKSDYELSIQPKDIKNGTDAADLTAEFSVTFEFLEKETLAELSSIIKKLNNEWRYEYEGKNAELVFSEGDWYVSIDKNINYDLIPIETQLSLKNNNFLIAQHNGTKWELAVNHEVFVNEDRNLWNNNDYTDVNLKIELGYNRKSAKPIIKGNSELIEQLRISLRNHWEVKREPLPVFAYYGSSEISTKVTYIPDFRLSFEQVYSEVLSPATFSLNTIYNWFRSKQEIANHERKIKSEIAFNALGQEVANIRTNFEKLIEKSGENTPIPEMIENLLRKYEANIAEVEAGKQLNLVENVVLEMLTDETATYSDLQISFDSITKEAHLSIKKQMPHESEATALALNQLSSGEKHLLAIVADLAIRMIELNPKVANPLKEGEGIVIIDEIDTHLHPLWQQKVVTKLREVFANVEFVVTTHSPEVLKGLDRKHLRIVKNNSVTSKVPYIKGRDNNAILQDAFGIYERLPEYEKKLSQFYKYVENDKNQARKILDELTSDWGEMDTEIVRAESYFEIF
ncbi:MAG: AAA family ATPase [Emticicia sp.]|nr:AAA family ATPase [Emticicia sp.]